MKWLGISWAALSGLMKSIGLVLLLNSVHTPFEKIVIALLALILVSLSTSSYSTGLGLAAIIRKVDPDEAEECEKMIEEGGAGLLISNIANGIFYVIAIGQLVLIILNR